MAQKSNIQWTDATWNIARGCTKVDEDCKYCYMYRDSMNNTRYNPLQVVKTKTVFNMPLSLKEPSRIYYFATPSLICFTALDKLLFPIVGSAAPEPLKSFLLQLMNVR